MNKIQLTTRTYTERANDAVEKVHELISTYADCRLIDLCSEFRLKFPKRSLKIIFGNGDEFISVDGYDLKVYGDHGGDHDLVWKNQWANERQARQLKFVADAVREVWDITDHYSRGCPKDIEVLPDDSELGGGPNGEPSTRPEEVGDNSNPDNGVNIPGYNCPRPGSPVDPVHIQ